MNLTRCRVITTIWNYFLLTSYFWIFVEGLYLHNIIYITVFREPNVWPFALLGWGMFFLFFFFSWSYTNKQRHSKKKVKVKKYYLKNFLINYSKIIKYVLQEVFVTCDLFITFFCTSVLPMRIWIYSLNPNVYPNVRICVYENEYINVEKKLSKYSSAYRYTTSVDMFLDNHQNIKRSKQVSITVFLLIRTKV